MQWSSEVVAVDGGHRDIHEYDDVIETLPSENFSAHCFISPSVLLLLVTHNYLLKTSKDGRLRSLCNQHFFEQGQNWHHLPSPGLAYPIISAHHSFNASPAFVP